MPLNMGSITEAIRKIAEQEQGGSSFDPGPDSPAAPPPQSAPGGGKGSSNEEDPMSQWQDRRPQFQARRYGYQPMFSPGRFSGGNRNAMQARMGLGRMNPGGSFTPPPNRPNPTFKPYSPPPPAPPSGGGKGSGSAPQPGTPTTEVVNPEWEPQRNADGEIAAGQHRIADSANTARLARKYGTNSTKGGGWNK
jgi:hypothetical protein